MKIKVVEKSYAEASRIRPPVHRYPARQRLPMRLLLKLVSAGDIKSCHVAYTGLSAKEHLSKPCLVLMNHSSFIDLKIASDWFFPHPFSIVCTSDGFVGKYGLMRALGCIPTQKFVTSPTLVKDIAYALRTLGQNVLMYPEASYTFDGTATPLPEGLGKLVRLLKVPVVTLTTHGAFLRDPLYNGLQLRKVDVDCAAALLVTAEEAATLSPAEINVRLKEAFTFDNFRWQTEHRIRISEPFRADGLNRVLFLCPHCGAEGKTVGQGEYLTCTACGKRWHLTEYGALEAETGETEYPHIPDWYAWERETVRREIVEGRYRLDIPVSIRMLADYQAIYTVGEGRLTHTIDGFHLTGCGGALDFKQGPAASYGLYADYYWYELGDMICIGDANVLYYCFPQGGADVVAKTRLAAEELYKLNKRG